MEETMPRQEAEVRFLSVNDKLDSLKKDMARFEDKLDSLVDRMTRNSLPAWLVSAFVAASMVVAAHFWK